MFTRCAFNGNGVGRIIRIIDKVFPWVKNQLYRFQFQSLRNSVGRKNIVKYCYPNTACFRLHVDDSSFYVLEAGYFKNRLKICSLTEVKYCECLSPLSVAISFNQQLDFSTRRKPDVRTDKRCQCSEFRNVIVRGFRNTFYYSGGNTVALNYQ